MITGKVDCRALLAGAVLKTQNGDLWQIHRVAH